MHPWFPERANVEAVAAARPPARAHARVGARRRRDAGLRLRRLRRRRRGGADGRCASPVTVDMPGGRRGRRRRRARAPLTGHGGARLRRRARRRAARTARARRLMRGSSRLDGVPEYLTARLIRTVAERARARRRRDLARRRRPRPAAAARLREALGAPGARDDVHAYPTNRGLAAAARGRGALLPPRFGVELDPEREIIPLLGAKEGLAHLCLAQLDPGDVALVADPGYPVYVGGPALAGAEAVGAAAARRARLPARPRRRPRGRPPARQPADLRLPQQPDRARSPTSPSSSGWRPGASQRGVPICHDNAYSEITFDGFVAPSFLQAPGAREAGIEIYSLSKALSLPGWRIAFAVGNAELIGRLRTLKTNIDSGMWLALQHAAIARSSSCRRFTRAACASSTGAAATCSATGSRRSASSSCAPRGALYVWMRVPGGDGSIAFAERLLERGGRRGRARRGLRAGERRLRAPLADGCPTIASRRRSSASRACSDRPGAGVVRMLRAWVRRSKMIEHDARPERAVLVAVLAQGPTRTASSPRCASCCAPRRSTSSATSCSTGRASTRAPTSAAASSRSSRSSRKEHEAEVVVTDDELSPSQQRVLEDELEMRVVDRTRVILDIFALHAHTRRGQAPGRARAAGVQPAAHARHVEAPRAPRRRRRHARPGRVAARDRPPAGAHAHLAAAAAPARAAQAARDDAPAARAQRGARASRSPATRTSASRRCSTRSPAPRCRRPTASSRRSTRRRARTTISGARTCSPTPSASSASCRTSSSRRSRPRSRRRCSPTSCCTSPTPRPTRRSAIARSPRWSACSTRSAPSELPRLLVLNKVDLLQRGRAAPAAQPPIPTPCSSRARTGEGILDVEQRDRRALRRPLRARRPARAVRPGRRAGRAVRARLAARARGHRRGRAHPRPPPARAGRALRLVPARPDRCVRQACSSSRCASCTRDARPPARAYEGDAGFDLVSVEAAELRARRAGVARLRHRDRAARGHLRPRPAALRASRATTA